MKAAAKKRVVKRSKKAEAMVSFTPDRTLPLTVNGRTIEVHAGHKATIPVSYKAVYDSAS